MSIQSSSTASFWGPVAVGIVAIGGGLALTAYQKEMAKLEKPAYRVLKALGDKKRGWFSRENAAEVREYNPVIIAEITFDTSKPEEAAGVHDIYTTSRTGFRNVANYIFGNSTKAGATPSAEEEKEKEKIAMTAPVRLEMIPKNPGPNSEKIAMTAPVRLEMQGGDAVAGSSKDTGIYKLSFIMPSKYTLDTLPRPNNPRVQLREVPGKTFAAISFSGSSPREEKVDQKKAELLALLQGSGYRVKEGSSVILDQHHPPFLPGFLRLNEVLLEVEAQGEGK